MRMLATVAGSSRLDETATVKGLVGCWGRSCRFDSYLKYGLISSVHFCTAVHHMLLFWMNLASVFANKGRVYTTYAGILEHIANI